VATPEARPGGRGRAEPGWAAERIPVPKQGWPWPPGIAAQGCAARASVHVTLALVSACSAGDAGCCRTGKSNILISFVKQI